MSAGALIFYPRGQFFVGTVVITLFVFNDMLDGALARASGKVSKWGAFFDSTLDRLADAAIFSGLVLWFAGDGDHLGMVALCLYCLAAAPSVVREGPSQGLACAAMLGSPKGRTVAPSSGHEERHISRLSGCGPLPF